jgi:hypothetical protein
MLCIAAAQPLFGVSTNSAFFVQLAGRDRSFALFSRATFISMIGALRRHVIVGLITLD